MKRLPIVNVKQLLAQYLLNRVCVHSIRLGIMLGILYILVLVVSNFLLEHILFLGFLLRYVSVFIIVSSILICIGLAVFISIKIRKSACTLNEDNKIQSLAPFLSGFSGWDYLPGLTFAAISL